MGGVKVVHLCPSFPRFHSAVQRPALSVARAKPERRKGPSYGKIGPFDPGIPHGNCVSSFESDLMRGFRSVQATSCASRCGEPQRGKTSLRYRTRQGGFTPCSTSIRVSYPRTFRGRALRRSATACTSASETCLKSVAFGKYSRTRPLVCSFRPRSREWQGRAKKKSAPVSFDTRVWSANSLPLSEVIVWGGVATEPSSSIRATQTAYAVFLSTRLSRVYFVARSTSDTIAPLWPFPMIVSASQSPIRFFLSTTAGRCEMSTRPGMWPRPAWLPPFQFGFLPRRRR